MGSEQKVVIQESCLSKRLDGGQRKGKRMIAALLCRLAKAYLVLAGVLNLVVDDGVKSQLSKQSGWIWEYVTGVYTHKLQKCCH